MKVGIIAPTKMLTKCCSLSNIQYCIPSILLSDPKYFKYYSAKCRDSNLTILDSKKLGWKRAPEDFSLIEEAMDSLGTPLVILPSKMFDPKASAHLALDFISYANPKVVAGCLEGTTTEEVLLCKEMYETVGISTFAIPSHIYSLYKGEDIEGPNKIYIENHARIEELTGLSGVLVTSLPVRLGLDGRLVSDPLPSPPSLTFKEEEKFPEIVRRNILETLEFYGS